jgi:hypothetical protein
MAEEAEVTEATILKVRRDSHRGRKSDVCRLSALQARTWHKGPLLEVENKTG